MALFDHQKDPRPALPSDTDIEAELNVLTGTEDSAPHAVPAHVTIRRSRSLCSTMSPSRSTVARCSRTSVFFVRRGETLCILGRSGVGKSVSLRMLMGFLKPDSGTIQVEGEEIITLSEEGLRAIRKRITMVFQNGALFDSMSVRENVAFPLREKGGLVEDQVTQIVDRLIDLAGAHDVVDAFPASLSTGRKRAVAMARALAAQPEIVLYDEPTTMVDPITARRLGDLIQRLKFQLGFTSIVVTHDTRFAQKLADSVLFLHQGRALFFGPP